MRKAILILSVMVLCGAALSCDKTQSPFDKSSIERTERELDMYRFALQARGNWVVEYFPDEDLSFALADVEALSPRYAAIKKGEIAPVGCGKCAYCRSVKRLEGITHYKKISVLEE